MKQFLNMSNVLCFVLFFVGNSVKGEEIWDPARRTHRPSFQTVSAVEEQNSTVDLEGEVSRGDIGDKKVYFQGVSSVTEATVTSQTGSPVSENRSDLLTAVIDDTSVMKVASPSNHDSIFNYEGAVFSSAVPLFQLMMNGTLMSKAHLSSEKEKPLSLNQPLLNSGKLGLTEPITPFSAYTGRSIPLISIFRPSGADNLAESYDAQEKKGKNKSENDISQLFKGSYPLNRKPLVLSDEVQLSVTRASTKSPVGLTFPYEKGYTETKNIVSLTLQNQPTGSLKQGLPPSLTTTSKTHLWATTVFAKAFLGGEEEDIQTNGVKETTGPKAMAVTEGKGTALMSNPPTSLSHGPEQNEVEGTPSPVLLRSTTLQAVPATLSFWSFKRTPEKRKERMSHIYMVSQPQKKIAKGPSVLTMQEQIYRTEPEQEPSHSHTASTFPNQSHFVQTTSGFLKALATRNKHRPPASEENHNEKNKFVQQSTEIMVVKSDLSKFETLQMLYGALANHTIPGKEKDAAGVTFHPLNNIFHKAQSRGRLKLGDSDNQTESGEVSVSYFVPEEEKEMLAMGCHDCITGAASASSQGSFATALPKVPPLISTEVNTENLEISDPLNFKPLQLLEESAKASTLFPEFSHQKLTKAIVIAEKLIPVPPRFISHPQSMFISTGNGLSQFERQILTTTQQRKYFIHNPTTKLTTVMKRLTSPHIFSQRTDSLSLSPTTIRTMREISSLFEKLPVKNAGMIHTPTKSVSSRGSLKAANYNKDRYPTVLSESPSVNESVNYSLEKKTTSAVKGIVSEGIADHGSHRSNMTFPVTVSSGPFLRKTYDRENTGTKESLSLRDGSLTLNKGLKQTKNPDFSHILHVTKATDVRLTPSRSVFFQSVIPAIPTVPSFAMRTLSLSVTHQPSQRVLSSKHKVHHSSPEIENNTKSFAFALFSLQPQEAIIQKQEMRTNLTFNAKSDTSVGPVNFINAIFKYTPNPLDLAVKSRLSQSTVTPDIPVRPSEVLLPTAHLRKVITAITLEPENHFTTTTGHTAQLVSSAYASLGDQESVLDTQPAAVIDHTSPYLLNVSSEMQTHSPTNAMTLPPSTDYFLGQTVSEDFSLNFFGVQSVAGTDKMKTKDLIPGVPSLMIPGPDQAGFQHAVSTSFPGPKSDVKNVLSVPTQPLLEEDSFRSMVNMSLSPLNSTNEAGWKTLQPVLLQKGSKKEDAFLGKHFIHETVAETESQHAIMAQRMRLLSPSYFLTGLADVSDNFCGTGNYTAEMSLSLDSEVLPGDSVPALGNLHVVISLKTNSSQANLTIKSCCISPSPQLDKLNATCSLFTRLPFDPRVIRLLPSDLPSTASFTIRLFQMTNYSTAYLHCDLSVCPRNHTDCEWCLQHRPPQFEEGVGTFFISSGNRISFGPVLKGNEESTVADRTDTDNTSRSTLILGSGLGCLLLVGALLLLWLGYQHKKRRWACLQHNDQGGQTMWSHWV